MVAAARYLTLLWPGMPWLWLRGSAAGLVLALAFAVVLDLAIVATWIYSEFFGLPVSLGLWAAAAAVWIIATGSAVSAFPPPIRTTRDAAADALFVAARDAYLARDWLAAETKLRSLLVVAPTDGEAQLLLATLLRRVGRLKESREALEKLSRSDSGNPWLSAIARELERVAAAAKKPPAPATTTAADDEETAILSLDRGSPAEGLGERAA
jgi:hypothetical protein